MVRRGRGEFASATKIPSKCRRTRRKNPCSKSSHCPLQKDKRRTEQRRINAKGRSYIRPNKCLLMDGRTDLSSSRLLTQMSLFETGKKEEKERREKKRSGWRRVVRENLGHLANGFLSSKNHLDWRGAKEAIVVMAVMIRKASILLLLLEGRMG